MKEGGEIIEITSVHPDGTTLVCSVKSDKNNTYNIGLIADKQISIIINNETGVLKIIKELAAIIFKTKIPAVFTFTLVNGSVIRGMVSEIKIIHIKKYTIKLELFGNLFKRIL